MKAHPLTEAEWRLVFEVRCLSKQGKILTHSQQKLCTRAFQSDKIRYTAMTDDVFEATKPFGSVR